MADPCQTCSGTGRYHTGAFVGDDEDDLRPIMALCPDCDAAELMALAQADVTLANTIIQRLNALIENADVRRDVGKLIEARVPCSNATLDHPTIQAGWPTIEAEARKDSPEVGFLGVLNGLVGARPTEPKKGWGYITAEFDDNGALVRFTRTVE